MSRSQTAPLLAPRVAEDPTVTVVDGEDVGERLVSVLDDPDCRAILDATDDRARSAKELAEECDLPLSTTYRKLDRLTETEAVTERTRIRRTGKHVSEYRRLVGDVLVTVVDGGNLEVRVSRRDVFESPADSGDGAEAETSTESGARSGAESNPG
jgi:DNA-binding transcriptional ArsR family regulator